MKALFEKNDANIIYNETPLKIQNIIGGDLIEVSVNKTIHVNGCYIGNAIIGKLSSELYKPFLINC